MLYDAMACYVARLTTLISLTLRQQKCRTHLSTCFSSSSLFSATSSSVSLLLKYLSRKELYR